ncbi:hypothetical protein [Parasphingorhabdus sp.]|jgi:hypothetical protein|uniref:hypothetical protein n=1 Tax=Parasphingorhabdus sp. TaxID=2709688 RepID=UPI003096CAA2|nr:hypothetical protein [Sphingomonadales bacterium]
MRVRNLILPAALILAACSETPVEDKGNEAIAEMENQIEQESQSLEEAADKAVKALEEDIDAELATDGIADPAAKLQPEATEN